MALRPLGRVGRLTKPALRGLSSLGVAGSLANVAAVAHGHLGLVATDLKLVPFDRRAAVEQPHKEPNDDDRASNGRCGGAMIGRVSGRGGDPPKTRNVTQYQVKSQPAVWFSGEPVGELDHGFDTKDPPKRHAGRHCWRRLANAAEMLCFDKVESKLVEEPVR